MPAPEPRVPVPGPCVFGAGRLLPLIDVTSKEITGVRDDDDIEHIHRMRVASRRLRAALPLFSSCFPEKDFRHWMHEIKSVTRALGEARDTDVQIAFLKKYLKAQAVPVPAGMTEPAPAQSYAGDPIAALLSRLQKRRGLLQQQVISALDELEETLVLSGIQAACPVPAAAGRGRRRARYFGVLPVAADRIGRRLAGLDRFEPFVHNPDAVFEHHAMRIAAKKLRYTLETYAPLYRRELGKPIARIKRLQDLLGDIHDCDVWIEQMTLAIIKQRAHRYPRGDLPGAAVSAVAPLRRLLVNRERCRARLYRQFVRYWDTLVRTGFWDELRLTVLEGQRTAVCHRPSHSVKEERAAFVQLATMAPEHAAHGRTVAALSLRLFDELAPLHGLGSRDRALLDYAATIHDIGWLMGQVGHQKKSAELILSCGDLTVPVREQGIIALVTGLHGGSTRSRPTGFWLLLSPADQKRVRILAALLRVADGLDYLHAASVTDLHCTIGGTEVQCVITFTGDVATEKARAIKKSDLFADVFGRTLVIP
ncbi:CHAD domain-containing protein [Methanoregula sp.]|uniref:CHAD domain-containing protein n=1 Tax=Methanoregula sp. TaxID=2052170 RepID=UPI0025F410D0|nr:CHAD domain-containing protein [Methanoregula sp.]